ncbi:DNA polymerase III subunit beta [Psychrobacillus sp. FSL K6-1415]|uniref:DNA polymerase III subunit beta n=1 Tax=Psychrobacillus sp. FSL K6-1415 TaxID=2921544 RepID=UPI0030F83334
MEFKINKVCFTKAISDVSKVVSMKALLPVLSGIKIVVNSDHLILSGSNSEIAIERVIPLTLNNNIVLDVIETGSFVLSSKHLSEIVKKLPDDIHIKMLEKQLVTIQSEEITIHLNGFSSEEYPTLPDIDLSKHISIPSNKLLEIIEQTMFAVSKNMSRPVLTGINITLSSNEISFIATNSQRLASRKYSLVSDFEESFTISEKILRELSKLIKNEIHLITIYFSGKYIVFKSDDLTLFSNLIEGSYPNTSRLFPKDAKTIITLNTKQFLQGVDRACLFANEWRNNNVHLEIENKTKIKISSYFSEIGLIEETQPIKEITGETNLKISLDASFLMDALTAIKEEEIKMSFSGSMGPILIEPINNPSYIQLISQVRAN